MQQHDRSRADIAEHCRDDLPDIRPHRVKSPRRPADHPHPAGNDQSMDKNVRQPDRRPEHGRIDTRGLADRRRRTVDLARGRAF